MSSSSCLPGVRPTSRNRSVPSTERPGTVRWLAGGAPDSCTMTTGDATTVSGRYGAADDALAVMDREGRDTVRTPAVAARRSPVLPVEWIALVVALSLRVPFLHAPAAPDEAGFLQVAGQWSPGGGSLYGRYWVDRPPLLIGIYQLAAAAGGIVPLRLLGCAAVAVTVLACAATARMVGGRPAARWSAVIAAALLVAPQLGAQEVNGELLAAPFVALGVWALVGVVGAPRTAAAAWRAAAAGLAATSAVLVKQNIVDVFVFAAVLSAVLAVHAGVPGGRSPVRTAAVAGGFTVGAATAATIVGGWAVLHGTSLADTWQAMYAFRVQAAHVVAEGGGGTYAEVRALALGVEWVRSGLVLITVAVVASVRRWHREPVMVALVATMAFDLASAALGGGYWRHYLVQLVVPAAVAVGVLSGRADRVARVATLAAAGLTALAALGATLVVPPTPTAATVGAAVARAGEPGDTLTTLYGDPRVNLAAGMSSPYANLWSLPIRTRDPHLTDLHTVLAGSRRPTWLVVLRQVSSWGLDTSRVARLVGTQYHPVADCGGVRIYLRQRVSRPTPTCTSATSAVTATRWGPPTTLRRPDTAGRR